MTNLRELINKAIDDIATYRNPDVSEVSEKLDEIIKAAELGGISHDYLVSLNIYSGKVILRTEYSVRGCQQSDDYEFPEWIIDKEDPVKAAKKWGWKRKVDKAQREFDSAKRIMNLRENDLLKAQKKLEEIKE